VIFVVLFCVLVVSLMASLATLQGVSTPPGWAFKEAHRMTKTIWVLIALVGLIPPLGLVSSVLWISCGYTVGRAWKRGNPATYSQYQDARAEALERHRRLELQRQQQEQLRRNRTW
jgi:hypothetical protein